MPKQNQIKSNQNQAGELQSNHKICVNITIRTLMFKTRLNDSLQRVKSQD